MKPPRSIISAWSHAWFDCEPAEVTPEQWELLKLKPVLPDEGDKSEN